MVVCPICGRDDQVQNVSDLYGLETANASKFRRTARPPLGIDPRIRLVLIMGLILLGVVPSFLVGVATGNALWFVASGLLAGLSVVVVPRYQSYRLHYQAQRAERNAWRRSVQRWQELYGCLRDDCVFDSKSGECVSAERMGDLVSSGSDMDASATSQLDPEKPVPIPNPRHRPDGLPRILVIGQVGILLISLGLTFTLAVFLSLNFSDPSRTDTETARQVIRVIGNALLVGGVILVSFLTVPTRDH